MTAIHPQASQSGWRQVLHRPQRASRLVARALAAVRDRRRRNQIVALDERTLRDIGICRSDPLYLESEQKERDAWLDTLRFPPF
jgi:uncharacterized protein YjiS (DUF1127 family)